MNKQRQRAEELVEQAKVVVEQAEAEGRELTDAESTVVDGAISRAKRLETDESTRRQINQMFGAGAAPAALGYSAGGDPATSSSSPRATSGSGTRRLGRRNGARARSR